MNEILNDIPDAHVSSFDSSCFFVNSSYSFMKSVLYKNSDIIPIDGASVMAILALDLKGSENILDLCCAPGAKLVVCSSILKNKSGIGSITGVDISKNRLEVCRSLVKKYRLRNVRLFLKDGIEFNIPPHIIHRESRERPYTYSKDQLPFFTTSEYRKRPGELLSHLTYDKVIVDVPCTHDGSLKHIQELIKCDWKSFDGSNYTQSSLDRLSEVQFLLLENAFRLVKKNGHIIYSTCSFSKHQNQIIIDKFMGKYAESVKKGKLPTFISPENRFCELIHPEIHKCGALFIAILIKC